MLPANVVTVDSLAMHPSLRSALEWARLYHPLRDAANRRIQRRDVRRWLRTGRPAPPPAAIKARILRTYVETLGLRVFIETGTYRGDMVEAMRGAVDRIHSIELQRDLHEAAARRFAKKPGIHLVHGDSAVELHPIVRTLDEPALFWLDAHYWEGVTPRFDRATPVIEELDAIFDAPERGHVVVIDDARCFGVEPGFPALETIEDLVRSRRPALAITMHHDAIHLAPRDAAIMFAV
jgi:hypothetical protein